MVHGEDFVGVGNPIELGRIRAALENECKLKVEMLSGDKSDVQEVKNVESRYKIDKNGA